MEVKTDLIGALQSIVGMDQALVKEDNDSDKVLAYFDNNNDGAIDGSPLTSDTMQLGCSISSSTGQYNCADMLISLFSPYEMLVISPTTNGSTAITFNVISSF